MQDECGVDIKIEILQFYIYIPPFCWGIVKLRGAGMMPKITGHVILCSFCLIFPHVVLVYI